MFCLESRDEMPASREEVAEAEEENIKVNPSWGPKEVLVDESGKVTGIVLKKCMRTIDPETKRFSPVYDENETIEVKADKIVFAIGQAIEWGNLLEGTKVTFWHGNYPVADKFTYQTEDPDIFVGGDVYTGPRFVIDAIAAGHEAAESLHRHARPDASMTIGRDRRSFTPLNKDDIKFPSYDTAGRQEAGMDESIDAKMSFKDAHLDLTEEQVKIETGRCLGCGASYVDYNKCIGCGLCTTKCEFDAIHLVRDHPECSKMCVAEDKVGGLLKYSVKRAFKILGHLGSDEAKEMAKSARPISRLSRTRIDFMHELGIVLHVIDQVEELAKENNVSKVTRLTLEVGEVSSIVPSYFSDCFEWAKKKTEYMQDTELEMIILEGVSYCKDCKKTYKDNGIRKKCPHCGSDNTYLVTGNELRIKGIAVVDKK